MRENLSTPAGRRCNFRERGVTPSAGSGLAQSHQPSHRPFYGKTFAHWAIWLPVPCDRTRRPARR